MRSCWTSISILLLALAAPCICLARAHTPQEAVSWPDLIQNPYEHLPIPDIGLKPLLQAADGETINTKQAWAKHQIAIWPRRPPTNCSCRISLGRGPSEKASGQR
jgi:hypothetical protein